MDARIEQAARAGWEWECERLNEPAGWDAIDATLRANLLDVCGVMLAAADAVEPASGSSEVELLLQTLIERHASLLADAERSSSGSRAHNLRTKASGIGEAIALLRAASEASPAQPEPLTREKFIECAKAACERWWDSFGGSENPKGEWDGLDATEQDYWCHVADGVLAERAAAPAQPEPASDEEWREVLDELVEILDPEEGSWPSDLSTCAYYRRGLPGADPEGTCGFGCSQEPECQTCRPREGWPLERARVLLGWTFSSETGWQRPDESTAAPAQPETPEVDAK